MPDTDTLMQLLRHPLGQYYISVLLVMLPASRIFRRAGLSPLFALLLLFPFAGCLLCVACLAFNRWPRMAKEGKG